MRKFVYCILLTFVFFAGLSGCNGGTNSTPGMSSGNEPNYGMPSGKGPDYENENGENGQKLKLARNILQRYQDYYAEDTTYLLQCIEDGIKAKQCPNRLRMIRSTFYVHTKQYDKGLAELDSVEPEVINDIYGPTFLDGLRLRISALKAHSEGDDSTYRKLIHEGAVLTGSYIADHKEAMIKMIKAQGWFYKKDMFPISTLAQYLLFQIEDDKKEYIKFSKEMTKAIPRTKMIFDNIYIMATSSQEYFGL